MKMKHARTLADITARVAKEDCQEAYKAATAV
jgi:hypothetical protein